MLDHLTCLQSSFDKSIEWAKFEGVRMKLLNGPLRRLGTSQLELYNLCLHGLHTVDNKSNVTAVDFSYQ